MIRSVLMVCEGNVCRSPLAGALLARALPGIEVASAGTRALVGEGADSMVAEVAREHGISLDSHVATQLDTTHVREADLILTMTQQQRDSVESAWPFARGKVFRLCDQDGSDVIDPYRRHRTVCDLVFAQITHGISQWSRTIAGQR